MSVGSASASGAPLWQNAVNGKTTVSSLYTYISNTASIF
jgi:hypothetical protein